MSEEREVARNRLRELALAWFRDEVKKLLRISRSMITQRDENGEIMIYRGEKYADRPDFFEKLTPLLAERIQSDGTHAELDRIFWLIDAYRDQMDLLEPIVGDKETLTRLAQEYDEKVTSVTLNRRRS